jgi:hypothetical protein
MKSSSIDPPSRGSSSRKLMKKASFDRTTELRGSAFKKNEISDSSKSKDKLLI